VHRPGPAPKAAVIAQHWYDRCLGFGQDFGEGLYDGFKAPVVMGWNASVARLLIDPKGFGQAMQEEGDAAELTGKHPEEVGKALIDWNDWTSGHQGRATGELTATVATMVALSLADGSVAGASAAVREAPETAPIRLSTAESWRDPATLVEHFARHGPDFGSVSEDDYARQACAFLQRSQALGLPTKIDSKGIIRIYDPNTNTFGAFNSDGTTRTFFRPDPNIHHLGSNWDYWLSQGGAEPVGGWTP
jgi:hypothetical protein